MSKPEGIYLSADYRVTDARTSRVLDDAASKMLTIHYPPLEGGPKVLLAFTGLAVLPDGTPMLQWIRESLRGESEVIDQSMAHLGARLKRDIASLRPRVPLVINFLVLESNDRRLVGAFTNLRRTDANVRIAPRFEYQVMELSAPFCFANGSGAAPALADGHMERLRPHLEVVPRKPLNHMNLLASLNRRVARRDPAVSPYCHVSFIGSSERFPPQGQTFTQRGESVPFEMPFILAGIDMTESMRSLAERFVEWRGQPDETPFPEDDDPDLTDRSVRRRS